MRAIETTATVYEQHRLIPDREVPLVGTGRVRLLILLPDVDEVDEQTWLSAAAASPSFDSLRDAEEDIYSPEDGVPFHVQRQGRSRTVSVCPENLRLPWCVQPAREDRGGDPHAGGPRRRPDGLPAAFYVRRCPPRRLATSRTAWS